MDSSPNIPRTPTREHVHRLTSEIAALKEHQASTAEEVRLHNLESKVALVDKLLHRAVAGAFALAVAVVTAAGGGMTLLLQQRDAASRRDERIQLLQYQLQRLEDRFDGRARAIGPQKEDF